MAHDWKIAEREYARQLSRRGKLHAYESLNPASTALVVVDMVPFFVEANPYCQAAIAPINLLAGALRAVGGAVAWVVPSSYDPFPELSREFLGPEIAELFRTSGGADRLCPELQQQAGDLFVEKPTPTPRAPTPSITPRSTRSTARSAM